MKNLYATLVFLLLCLYLTAQKPSETLLSPSYSNLSFQEFAQQLKKEKEVTIIYKQAWIDSVSILPFEQELPLKSVLTESLQKHELHYIEFQGNIVLLPGRQQTVVNDAVQSSVIVIGNPLNRGKFKNAQVTGVVIDGKTKTPIPGAQVLCETLSIATSTNANGNYQINLPVGENRLKFTFIGLNSELRDIVLYNDGKLDIELYEESINLNQVNVTADKPEDNYRSTSMGMVKMDMKSIKKLSVLMGEPDIIKSMVMLPGVQSTGENASGFNVRGGNVDQNLILVNETPVYNTSHLFGMFSMIDGGLVKDVTLYKSAMPSRYGGRISSVMNIDLNKGNTEKMKVGGSLGIINSRLSIEGPLSDKISVIAGGRSTYSDWILGIIKNYEIQQSSAGFYDFNAKVDYTINAKNKLSLFGYGSKDDFYYYQNAQYDYGNWLGAAKWSHIFNNNNSGSLNLNYSRYNGNIVDLSNQNVEYNLHTFIDQKQVAYHFSSDVIARHRFNLGASAINYLINPGESSPYGDSSIAPSIQLQHENAYELALYAEDEFDITPELAVIGGIRFSNFLLTGPDNINRYLDESPLNEQTYTTTDVYTDNGIRNYFNGWEPRLALRYEFDNASSVKMGYNRTQQYIRQISNSASITPADYWKTSDTYLKPLISDQLAIGYFQNFNNNSIETSLEVYYKNIQNVVDYKNGAQVVLNPDLEQVLVAGNGRAYGAELLIKKNNGDLTGWLAYTYSRSFMRINGTFDEEKINHGKWYNANYDKPHDLTIVLNYKISRRFTFSSNFTYSTGRPVTFPEQKYTMGTYEVVSFSERNKYRIPDYHRLDVAFTYEGSLLKKQKWRSSWTFSIYNLYGRNNAFSVFYEKQKPSYVNQYRTYSLYKFAIIGVPVPSFTYNFWF